MDTVEESADGTAGLTLVAIENERVSAAQAVGWGVGASSTTLTAGDAETVGEGESACWTGGAAGTEVEEEAGVAGSAVDVGVAVAAVLRALVALVAAVVGAGGTVEQAGSA